MDLARQATAKLNAHQKYTLSVHVLRLTFHLCGDLLVAKDQEKGRLVL